MVRKQSGFEVHCTEMDKHECVRRVCLWCKNSYKVTLDMGISLFYKQYYKKTRLWDWL